MQPKERSPFAGKGSTSKAINVLQSYSTLMLPNTVDELLDWGEWLWLRCGEYSSAISKTISYFLTDIRITGIKGHAQKAEYKDFLLRDLDVMGIATTISRDLFSYGNSFVSIDTPFNRSLICDKCKSSFPTKRVGDVRLEVHNDAVIFKGFCSACKKDNTFTRSDNKADGERVKIIRWDPRDITIEYNQITEQSLYYYKPNNEIIKDVKRNSIVYLDSTPWPLLQAVMLNKMIELNPSDIKHLKYDGISSLKSKLKGWGIPPFIAAFDQVVLLHLLKRYNETILTDFLIPFRFISPPSGGGGKANQSDPLFNMDAGKFMRSVEGMIKAQRNDPSLIHSIPYPVEYHVLGGEAQQLAPTEQLEYVLDSLYTTLGIPQEMYKTNLQTGGAPISLRIFERQHRTFFKELDNFLVWLGKSLGDNKLWEDATIKFVNTSVYEDQSTKETKLNLLASNKVSNDAALTPFGIDYEDEIDKIIDEQEMFDKKMSESSRDAQAAGDLQGQMDQPLEDPNAMPPEGGGAPMGGGGGGGGAPAGGPVGAGGQATMDDMDMQAEQQAQEILTMDPSTRKSTLINLKKTDETLHALVKSKLQTLEQQAAQQGLNMTRQGQLPPPGQQ